MMFRISMASARFVLSAWVGAASLFVVTGIREVRSPALDSYVRDVLVGARFPSYYLFGFTLVGLGLMATLTAAVFTLAKRGRLLATAAVLVLALLLMVGDFFWIYQPLLEMVTPPGQSRPAEFVDYHEASKWVNLASVSLCGLAAIFLCGLSTGKDDSH